MDSGGCDLVNISFEKYFPYFVGCLAEIWWQGVRCGVWGNTTIHITHQSHHLLIRSSWNRNLSTNLVILTILVYFHNVSRLHMTALTGSYCIICFTVKGKSQVIYLITLNDNQEIRVCMCVFIILDGGKGWKVLYFTISILNDEKNVFTQIVFSSNITWI